MDAPLPPDILCSPMLGKDALAHAQELEALYSQTQNLDIVETRINLFTLALAGCSHVHCEETLPEDGVPFLKPATLALADCKRTIRVLWDTSVPPPLDQTNIGTFVGIHAPDAVFDCDFAHLTTQNVLDAAEHALLSTAQSVVNLRCNAEIIDKDTPTNNLPANGKDSRHETIRQLAWIGLSSAHRDHFEHTDDPADLELQLACATLALMILPPLDGQVLRLIGSALSARYARLQRSQDYTTALAVLRHASAVALASSGDLIVLYYEIGLAHFGHYTHNGGLKELEASIQAFQQALMMVTDSHPCHYRILTELAYCHHHHFIKQGCEDDAAEDLRLTTHAELICPQNHIYRARVLLGLAGALCNKYQSGAEPQYLERSVEVLRDSLVVCPPRAYFTRVRILRALCFVLKTRHNIHGDGVDLDGSITAGRQALELDSSDPKSMFLLGQALYIRFLTQGDGANLEEAIQLCRQTLSLCPSGHPYRGLATHGLANLLVLRSEQSFSLHDIDEGVALFEESIGLRDPGELDTLVTKFMLADALAMRFVRTLNLNNLEEATNIQTAWMNNRSEKQVDMAWRGYNYLGSVGNLRQLRYKHLGEKEDLTLAIQAHEEALQFLTPENTERAVALCQAASAYRMRAERMNSVVDAEKAMELLSEALTGTDAAEGRRHRPQILFELAHAHLAPGVCQNGTGVALDMYCTAVTDPHCSAQLRLTKGLTVLQSLSEVARRADLTREENLLLLDAYRLTIHLLPRIAYCGLYVQDQYTVLSQAPTLAGDAAVHALSLSLPQSALELLEEGRTVFWVQFLRLRSPFHQLPPELADQLSKVATELERNARQSFEHLEQTVRL